MRPPKSRQYGLRAGAKPGTSRTPRRDVKAGSRYRTLMTVGIFNSYNDRDHGLCSDLTVIPTPACNNLMRSLGLVFQDRGAGFTVYYDEQRAGDLVTYLRNRAHPTPGGSSGEVEFWSRLSFMAIPNNPLFIGTTSLPIDTDPATVNFYVANSQARVVDGHVLLAPGEAVDSSDSYPVYPDSFALPVTPFDDKVVVTDVSGAIVWQLDIKPPAPPVMPAKFAQVDISALPFGLYNIKTVALGSPSPLTPFLYTAASPVPLCFLDFLLCQPHTDMAGVYPVSRPRKDAPVDASAISHVRYALRFEARSTLWLYYIVSQNRGLLNDLRIDSKGTQFRRQDKPVRLPNGDPATLFTADAPLPLRQLSPHRFSLHGSRRDAGGGDNEIYVACLPVASDTPVWPGTTPETGISEMFVYV